MTARGLGQARGPLPAAFSSARPPRLFTSRSLPTAVRGGAGPTPSPQPLTFLFCPPTPTLTSALRFGLGKEGQVALAKMEGLLEDPSGNPFPLPDTISI